MSCTVYLTEWEVALYRHAMNEISLGLVKELEALGSPRIFIRSVGNRSYGRWFRKQTVEQFETLIELVNSEWQILRCSRQDSPGTGYLMGMLNGYLKEAQSANGEPHSGVDSVGAGAS